MTANLSRQSPVILGMALLLAGCASAPKTPVIPPGPLAVVPAQFPPQADFNVYARGKGAAAGELGTKGAASGAAAGAIAPLGMGPIGVAAYPIIAPFTILAGVAVGGTVGATYGAINGLSADQAAQVDALVEQAVNRIGVHEEVARRVVERSRLGGAPATLLPQAGPRADKETPGYAELKQTYRAVLELAVDKVGMAARKGDPPRIALEMKLRARVVSLGEAGVSGDKRLEWAGKPHELDDWQAGGAELLAGEFERGYENLAQYVWEIVVAPARPSPGTVARSPADSAGSGH